jgi:hypothetical protein
MRDLAPNTAKAYARHIKRSAIDVPASPEQIAAYVEKLVAAGRKRQTIKQHLAALARQHHTLGAQFDTRHPQIMAAVERAEFSPKRRPPPVQQLEGKGFMPEQDARDQLLVYLHGMCGFTMEAIVGLDWQKEGEGTGYVRYGWNGVSHLSLSTGIVSARILNGEVVNAANAWARFADLKPGQPVFREIKNHKGKATILKKRLTPDGFRWILKNRRQRAATPSPGSDLPGGFP